MDFLISNTRLSPEAFNVLKGLFDSISTKVKMESVAHQLLNDHGCDCSLTWEQCMAVVEEYRDLTSRKYSVPKLEQHILATFGKKVTGSKENLVRLAMTGVAEYV
jgi:hypothetical protein